MSTDERPAPRTDANSLLDQIRSGAVAHHPDAKVDPQIYDPDTHQPILMGNNDPLVIGADDHYNFAYRSPDSYPDVPPPVKKAEISFILPMAKLIADTIGITILDETAYERVLLALRGRALFVLLNIHKTKISDGIASWFGLILVCKQHPLVMVRFKMRLGTEQIGIDQVRLWENGGQAEGKYIAHRKLDGSFYDREEASALILNYLKLEGVLPEL